MSKKERKGLVKEFKEFIFRGNIVDMAVGVIVGGAFTAVVNGLSNFVLKPIINWMLFLITGSSSSEEIYTYLHKEYTAVDVLDSTGAPTGETVMELDLAKSIYIDWGSFINAIVNFLLIAFTLFVIIKVINGVRRAADEAKEKVKARKDEAATEETE